jgi:hypothetical protein
LGHVRARPKSSLTSGRFSLLCGDGGGGLADYVNDDVGVGEHDDVAAVHLDGGRSHPFRYKTLEVAMHGLIGLSHDVPARFRLPSDAIDFLLLLE